MAPNKKSLSVPNAMQARYEEIAALTDAFCLEKLNEECAQVCREMAAALARKRPSPLVNGPAKSWACGIVYTVASVNFLFDKSESLHTSTDEVSGWFGYSKSTAGSRSNQIKRILNINAMDPHWTLPSLMDSNPMAWYISVNGLIMDARRLPRPIQEEAYRKGLIPYIPEEKDEE